MRIKQLKHISDDCIAVLFDNCIILLQIGYNNALVVRQTLKFSRLDPLNEALKIIELLQSYDRYGIYVLDTQSRIFVLKMKDSANYCL